MSNETDIVGIPLLRSRMCCSMQRRRLGLCGRCMVVIMMMMMVLLLLLMMMTIKAMTTLSKFVYFSFFSLQMHPDWLLLYTNAPRDVQRSDVLRLLLLWT